MPVIYHEPTNFYFKSASLVFYLSVKSLRRFLGCKSFDWTPRKNLTYWSMDVEPFQPLCAPPIFCAKNLKEGFYWITINCCLKYERPVTVKTAEFMKKPKIFSLNFPFSVSKHLFILLLWLKAQVNNLQK